MASKGLRVSFSSGKQHNLHSVLLKFSQSRTKACATAVRRVRGASIMLSQEEVHFYNANGKPVNVIIRDFCSSSCSPLPNL